MKSVLTFAATLALVSTTAFAQVKVEGQATGNATGNADFPVEVIGADGNTYNCSIDIVAKNGTEVRRCVAANDIPAGSSLFAGGLGAGSVFLVVLAAGAVAAIASSGGGNSTNGTN